MAKNPAVIPQQKNLFTNRWSAAQKLEPKEFQIQISIISQLRLRAKKGILYFHIPNGELRDKRIASKLRAMGVLPGVPDLLFLWAGRDGPRFLFLELKRKGLKLTADQSEFARLVHAMNGDCLTADSVLDAMSILEDYGLVNPEGKV